MRDRLVDIPLPADSETVFENLHGCVDLSEFAEKLINIAAENHGVISREYMRRLCAWKSSDKARLQKFINSRKADCIDAAKKENLVNINTARLVNKFSILYAAGCLAIRFDLAPWTRKELRWALLKCQTDHTAHVAQFQPQDPRTVLLDFILRYKGSFIEYDMKTHFDSIQSAHPGFASDKRGEIMIPEKCFINIYPSPESANQAKDMLAREGVIKTNKDGRYVIKRAFGTSKNGKPRREYVIVIDIDALKAN